MPRDPLTFDPSSVVIQDALPMVAFGTVVGVPATLLVSRLLGTLIFGVTPTDPATVAGAIAVLALVGLAAAIGPARRAARVDPMLSLRAESRLVAAPGVARVTSQAVCHDNQ